MTFITDLQDSFSKNANATFAQQMKSYMVNLFEFYGIKATLRRRLLNEVVLKHKDNVSKNIRKLAFDLYQLPQRELHMCAIELFEKTLRKSYVMKDIKLIEWLITTNSHWDSVDFIAKQILGNYLLKFPEEIETVIQRFSSSKNMWLNRSAILFQLSYKEKTNETVLFEQCLLHKESNEFFIQKAIGWALREYGKVNPKAVLEFVNTTTLKPLSHREAIRRIIKK